MRGPGLDMGVEDGSKQEEFKDGPADGSETSSMHESNMSDEPGSPMFHDAIIFSSQVQLNDLFRERRQGLRRMD